MGNIELGKRIETRRNQLGLTLDDVASQIGVAKSTVQRYEKGNIEKIKMPVIEAIARVLDVNPAWICGKVSDMRSAPQMFGLSPLPSVVSVPRLGTIACGEPILAEQNIEGYDQIPDYIKCDFTLVCKGDSMTGARINDGDIVCIKQQPSVENGQIAAVLVDDEATLKRFYFEDGTVTLMAANPAYPPKTFSGESVSKVRVLGLATHFISKVL